MHVTLKDVARHAGVSTKTVSRVVNKQGELSPATRLRVQNAILELGYRPNILARSLVNRRSNTLAVIASGIEYYGPSRTLQGIELQADKLGYSIFLNLQPYMGETNAQEALYEVVARRVDGIVWAMSEIGDNHLWITSEMLESLPPVVFLTMETRPGLAIVAIDNRAGAKLAVQHLIQQHSKRIGIITGPLATWEARERVAGWQEALHDAGQEPASDLLVEGDWSPASGARAMHKLLRPTPRLDGLFASNDQMALGALGVLHQAQIAVPHDIALVGFDNIPESEFFFPPLTTVFQDMIDIGKLAVQELDAAIKAQYGEGIPHAPRAARLLPTLIQRTSSLRGTPDNVERSVGSAFSASLVNDEWVS